MIKVLHLKPNPAGVGSELVAQNEYSRAWITVRSPDVEAISSLFESIRTGAKKGLRLDEVAELDTTDLERAFELTNSIDQNWFQRPPAGVRPTAGNHRSTSVGDIMVIGDKAHLVAPFGFVEFAWGQPAAVEQAAEGEEAVEGRQRERARVS